MRERTGPRDGELTAAGRRGRAPESVWDYPRPPRAEPDDRRAVVRHGGVVVADTTDLVRILETSHPPTFYLPRTAFGAHLRPAQRTTVCEWKGVARYVDIVVPGAAPLRDVGWWYPAADTGTRSCATGWPSTRDRSTRSPSTASGSCRSPAGSTAGG